MDQVCYFCHAKAFESLLERHQIAPGKQKPLTRRFFKMVAEFPDEATAPELTREVHDLLRNAAGKKDLYKTEKKTSNSGLSSIYPRLRQAVQKSKNPFDTALRLAIGGNIIDFGPTQNFDLDGTLERVLRTPLAIDHSALLREKINAAENILYLGDNAGEIVLDKLFLETVAHPNVTFVVRDRPILNDVTMEDALEVGIDKVTANVISNGDDAPSTLLHRTSPLFNKAFYSADLIISKGMGNLEGLIDVKRDNLFFVLIVKCAHMAGLLGAQNGDFIVKLHNKK